MEKPILATNLDGFLIEHSAFIEPHKAWFDRAITKTGDESLEKWKGVKDYFVGVNEVMEKIMPDASKEERTKQARIWYQEDVVNYIKENPEVVNRSLVESLKKLKEKFTLALITTNAHEYVDKILEVAGLNEVYDIVFASSAEEEPSKEKIFQEFKNKYGGPKYYVSNNVDEKLKSFLEKKSVKVLSEEGLSNL